MNDGGHEVGSQYSYKVEIDFVGAFRYIAAKRRCER